MEKNMNFFGIIESSEVDVVKSVEVKDNNPANLIEAGYIAKYTTDGKVELATSSNVVSESEIAGVICGVSGQKVVTGLATQSVVCNGTRVAVAYKGSANLGVGTIMYLDADGTVTNIQPSNPIVVGIVSAHTDGNAKFAHIKLNNM